MNASKKINEFVQEIEFIRLKCDEQQAEHWTKSPRKHLLRIAEDVAELEEFVYICATSSDKQKDLQKRAETLLKRLFLEELKLP